MYIDECAYNRIFKLPPFADDTAFMAAMSLDGRNMACINSQCALDKTHMLK